jgi:hypothetical protein
MPQIFSPGANTWFRVILVATPLLLGGSVVAIYRLNYSSYATQVGVPVDQPVAFSHQHHVDGLGIDCRYCHTSVEKAAFAGMPSTETCMTCHSQLWTEAPLLEPVRNSLATNTPLRWTRVHNLADFVYFDHSIHVRKGISCSSCHGRIEQMPLTRKEKTLQMGWCLDCHRHPEGSLRPPDQEFNLHWKPNGNQEELGRKLIQDQHILRPAELTDCTMCHR